MSNYIQAACVGGSASLLPLEEVKMEVVFGSPSKHCAGLGICMIYHHDPMLKHTIQCPSFIAFLSPTPNLSLRFRFPKAGYTDERVAARLATDFFLVEERFYIPRSLASAWHLPSVWAAPGSYPVLETPQEWLLQIRMCPPKKRRLF